MKYPLAEVVDRLTILELKRDRLSANQAVANEAARLSAALPSILSHRLAAWRDDLKNINAKIWDLEADIRQGKEGLLGLEEVGRRAIAIRELNGNRIRIKNQIARLVGEFEEVKVEHASE